MCRVGCSQRHRRYPVDRVTLACFAIQEVMVALVKRFVSTKSRHVMPCLLKLAKVLLHSTGKLLAVFFQTVAGKFHIFKQKTASTSAKILTNDNSHHLHFVSSWSHDTTHPFARK